MNALPPGRRRICLALDIEKYSSRGNVAHIALQERLVAIVKEAMAHAQVPWVMNDVQDQGDGLLVIQPPGVDEPRVVPGLVNGLCWAVGRANSHVLSSRRLRLRVALSVGIVHRAAAGYVGDAVIGVSRLLDSVVLRDTLSANPGHDIALIVADDLYHDVIAHGYPGLDPAAFTKVHIEIPAKGFTADAWTHLPRLDHAGMAATGPRETSRGHLARDVAMGAAVVAISTGLTSIFTAALDAADHTSGYDTAGSPYDGSTEGADTGHGLDDGHATDMADADG
ncbi:hypothetical protein GCM10009677_11670 [Sphaerisporangium rubeum]|uniref:Adenylate/guanylate cyclase domain-containing protein n=1 Tax=Sphaerisporangium rubeum TaxID=321317 RepID=A0A7X0IDY8_9ACTN|nr:hypothetical protein [Sphaerisporangium rubeum]MBB6472213.1 hypothetical protein [Sphaerisporangium rubeum]